MDLPKLIISVQPNGSISVEGPIEQKLVCYGLLEVAKDIVRNHKPALVQIAPALSVVPNKDR